MKYFSLISFVVVTFFASSHLNAQITNLVINGSSSTFNMTSGDTVHWEFDIPTGATAQGEFWYDVNNNGTIDPATDKARFIFTQTDGDPSGNGGPPDLDGTANGHVIFYQPIGIAPGQYILRFTHNSASVARVGTVSPLASFAHTISGHITPPSGKSPQYVFIEVRRNNQYAINSWDAITDASGNYAIHMDADTAGNPWYVRIADNGNPFPPSIVSPEEIALTITGNHSGNDFVFVAAAAQVAGYLRDEFGTPIPDGGVSLNSQDTSYIYRNGRTNTFGFFQIGLSSGDLHGQSWTLQSENNNGDVTTTQLVASVNIPVINPGDSLFRQMTIYNVNSQITGQVQFNGNPPGFPMKIYASNSDSGQASAYNDGFTGNFTIPVSNKIQNYSLFISNLPFGWYAPTIIAHPGQSGVIYNITSSQTTYTEYINGWNMLSVPLKVFDYGKNALFPNATSAAYSYNGGYAAQPYLQNGTGYWLKFSSGGFNSITGYAFQQETLNVIFGWNMIGGMSDSLPTSGIVPVGTTITSNFYGYNGGYFSSTTLAPGYAYWVKVSSAGQLILGSQNVPSSPKGRAAILDDDLPPPPPGTEEHTFKKIPSAFALHDNYPNPFNPTTEFTFDIPNVKAGQALPVQLKIYNLLGQEIATLVNEMKEPGTYSIMWNAGNNTSGVYFYRIAAGELRATKKFVLMK